MTRIFVDSKEIKPPTDSSSISRILKYIDEVHLSQNSVVRQIQVNGHPLMPKDFSRAGDHASTGPIEKLDKVEIFTGNIAEIVRGSISEALAYLNRIESLIPLLAESFRKNPSQESFGNLRQLYEGFYWLNLLLDKLKANFPVHIGDALIRNGFAPEYHPKFISTLKGLKESQESGDLAQVSDLLEGEVLPFVPLWREILIAISQEVSGTQ
jgi:hypothetical protein